MVDRLPCLLRGDNVSAEIFFGHVEVLVIGAFAAEIFHVIVSDFGFNVVQSAYHCFMGTGCVYPFVRLDVVCLGEVKGFGYVPSCEVFVALHSFVFDGVPSVVCDL